MKTLQVRTRAAWRKWLGAHHDAVSEIWLVFRKGPAGRAALGYDEAVEEALCFGWVDSLIRRIDDARYARKFTPRKADSAWSTANRRRYAEMRRRGLLAEPGRRRPPTGRSGDAPRPALTAIPSYIGKALAAHPKARARFDRLAPSHRRAYIGWIDSAKREETKQRRLGEALRLLAAGKPLGMK